MGRLGAALVGGIVVIFFFSLTMLSAPTSPALATVEYMHDPATALLDRAAAREHDERMARIAIEEYEARMFWRVAVTGVVLAGVCAVLGVVLAVTSRRSVGGPVILLPEERKRLMG